MEFADLIGRMTRAAAAGDGAGVADCFTDDGVYHDVFYGTFTGRAAIGSFPATRRSSSAKSAAVW